MSDWVMDIERLDRLKSKQKKNRIYLILIIFALLAAVYFYYAWSVKASYVPAKQMVIDQVKRGDLVQSSRVNGQLVADIKYSLTAKSDAIVVQIHNKVGSLVKQGDVLIQLSSEQLEQSLSDIEFDLAAAEKNHSLLLSELSDEEMALKSELIELESKVEIDSLSLQAKEKLYAKNIISRLDINQVRVALKNLKKTYEFAKLKQQNFYTSKKAKIEADLITVKRLKKQLDDKHKLQQALLVTATTDGIVNAIDVELGQQVSAGTSLLKITGQEQFSALLKLNEAQSGLLAYDQLVVMNILNQEIKGKLSRISPNIVDNSVEIEVHFTDQLPSGVRPDMSISGEIFFSKIADTLLVDKPYGLLANQTKQMFVINRETQIASKRPIQFGKVSVSQAQIISGAEQGDLLIIDLDEKRLEEHHQLKVELWIISLTYKS